jgi:hypothetical protein
MIDNNLNLSICHGVKVNCQIRKLKITKLKQQVMPTYCHIDSTDVIENDFTYSDQKVDRSFQTWLQSHSTVTYQLYRVIHVR